jgi:hypothetical protein
MMKSKLIVFALASIPFSALAGLPTPGTLPKNGNCPSGYVAKAKECEPAKDARFAVLKSGECPADYEADGNYCMAGSGARLAIRRAAMTCPKGFTPIGDYCVSDN